MESTEEEPDGMSRMHAHLLHNMRVAFGEVLIMRAEARFQSFAEFTASLRGFLTGREDDDVLIQTVASMLSTSEWLISK